MSDIFRVLEWKNVAFVLLPTWTSEKKKKHLDCLLPSVSLPGFLLPGLFLTLNLSSHRSRGAMLNYTGVNLNFHPYLM